MDSNKTDSIDAGKLAELLRMNLVHPVYSEQNNERRTFKHLVTHYEQTSREQARQKSKIKARLRCPGIIRKDSALFSAVGQSDLLDSIREPEIKQMINESFAVLNQMLVSLEEAKRAMIEYSKRFPEVELLQTAPGVGIITACRFAAYVQTPQRFSNKQKLWRYARLAVTRRESNGKRLSHPRLDSAGVGSLKDVSRKVFEAAKRTKHDNSFKRFYEQSLEKTKNQVHARLSTQRKILACLRAMWLSRQPFRDDVI
jgi:transposase